MAIFLRHSYNIPPPRWGSFTDVQYAIKVNAEKIYDYDSDSEALIIPGFWGLPLLDYSKYGNNGINHGATYKDGSLDFDGDDWIGISDSNSLDLGNYFTVSFSICTSQIGNKVILEKGDGWNSDLRYYFFTDLDGSGGVQYGIKNDFVWILSDPINDGQRHHIVATYDNGTAKIYSDSDLDATDTGWSMDPPTTKDVYIGARSGGVSGIDTILDEVRISSAVYIAEQIALFHELPYGLYQKVSRPIYLLPIVAPTTAAPTTTPPTTVPPTTLAPATTLVPTTPIYTTVPPTTEFVATTPVSTTVAPTTISPTTLVPTTLQPTTFAPTTLAPTTLAPTSLLPTTLAPTTLAPTTLLPTTLAPTTLAPTTLQPTTLAPTTLLPTTIAPTSLAPTTVAPTTVAATTIVPTTIYPTTLVPTTLGPTTLPSTTAVPTTAVPLICVKNLESIITDQLLLKSPITKEMRIHGNLC